jgi:hypothetical protein
MRNLNMQMWPVDVQTALGVPSLVVPIFICWALFFFTSYDISAEVVGLMKLDMLQ